jgi:hypothetical protein
MNMKFHLFLFTCILICGYASAQNIRQVAGMDLSVAYQEYGGIMAGKSVTGEAARVAGCTLYQCDRNPCQKYYQN